MVGGCGLGSHAVGWCGVEQQQAFMWGGNVVCAKYKVSFAPQVQGRPPVTSCVCGRQRGCTLLGINRGAACKVTSGGRASSDVA